MRRDGFICDECDEEHKWTGPAAVVGRDARELCSDCYDDYMEEVNG